MKDAPTKPARRLRCAIYTRKSSEEGLEQEFNSLHAQREACEAYIASQKSEGWALVRDQYDDGGISGGTLERPGLKQLLADIEDGLVDVVVVYKIDRLSRSLMDFSKLVEVFDRNGVTFVSVTQSFNTTTSMGRLTLNILLSFAQFEREVTAERIRDKVKASRMKGMWMGGYARDMPVPGLDSRLICRIEHNRNIFRLLAVNRRCCFKHCWLCSILREVRQAAGTQSGHHRSARGFQDKKEFTCRRGSEISSIALFREPWISNCYTVC